MLSRPKSLRSLAPPMAPARKYVNHELKELAKKLKLPCNVKHEILLQLIRAKTEGDQCQVERILNDLKRERTKRRIEKSVIQCRLAESGSDGSVSETRAVSQRRRMSSRSVADTATACVPSTASKVIRWSMSSPPAIFDENYSLMELLEDPKKRTKMIATLGRETFFIPSHVKGPQTSWSEVTKSCFHQKRDAVKHESLSALRHAPLDGNHTNQALDAPSTSAVNFQSLVPINIQNSSVETKMAFAPLFHNIGNNIQHITRGSTPAEKVQSLRQVPISRSSATSLNNVVVQCTLEAATCLRERVRLAYKFLPYSPSGFAVPVHGSLPVFSSCNSKLHDLDSLPADYNTHLYQNFQLPVSQSDAANQTNISASYARHELTSTYNSANLLPQFPSRSSVIIDPCTTLIKPEVLEAESCGLGSASSSSDYAHLVDEEISRMRTRFTDDLACPIYLNELEIGTEVELPANGDINAIVERRSPTTMDCIENDSNDVIVEDEDMNSEESLEFVIIEEDSPSTSLLKVESRRDQGVK